MFVYLHEQCCAITNVAHAARVLITEALFNNALLILREVPTQQSAQDRRRSAVDGRARDAQRMLAVRAGCAYAWSKYCGDTCNCANVNERANADRATSGNAVRCVRTAVV